MSVMLHIAWHSTTYVQLKRDFTKRPGEFFHIRKIEFRIINFPSKMLGKFLETIKK